MTRTYSYSHCNSKRNDVTQYGKENLGWKRQILKIMLSMILKMCRSVIQWSMTIDNFLPIQSSINVHWRYMVYSLEIKGEKKKQLVSLLVHFFLDLLDVQSFSRMIVIFDFFPRSFIDRLLWLIKNQCEYIHLWALSAHVKLQGKHLLSRRRSKSDYQQAFRY